MNRDADMGLVQMMVGPLTKSFVEVMDRFVMRQIDAGVGAEEIYGALESALGSAMGVAAIKAQANAAAAEQFFDHIRTLAGESWKMGMEGKRGFIGLQFEKGKPAKIVPMEDLIG